MECLHVDISSLLLFRVDISGLHITKYFPHKHKLHLLLTFEYERACFTLRHLMLYVIFLSFRLQIYLLNSVACLYRSFLTEHTWFLYLNLKVVKVVYTQLESCVYTEGNFYNIYSDWLIKIVWCSFKEFLFQLIFLQLLLIIKHCCSY